VAGLSERRLLTVLGAVNWDISIFEDRFARQGEEVPVRVVEEFSGGKGANVAVAAARILGRGRVAFIGALGNDDISMKQVRELKSEGVITEGIVKVKGCQSGRAYIVVDGAGKKTIHTLFGANEKITRAHLKDERVANLIRESRMMIVMDTPTAVGRAAAEQAEKNGTTVIYSPGVRTQEGAENLELLIEAADYLVLDTIELRNLDSRMEDDAIMGKLTTGRPDLTLVATLGERGCAIAREGQVRLVGGVDVALLGRKVVNTTGCGDAFLGVFASRLILGDSVLDAVNWANLAGAVKAGRYETRGSPSRPELEREMKSLEKVRQKQLGLQENKVV